MATWLNALKTFLGAVDAITVERVASKLTDMATGQGASTSLITAPIDILPVRWFYALVSKLIGRAGNLLYLQSKSYDHGWCILEEDGSLCVASAQYGSSLLPFPT